MIDFTLAKITVSSLVLLLVATSIGYFYYLNGMAYESEAKSILRFVASKINELGGREVESKIIFTYNGTNTSLPPKVMGDYYTIFIGGSTVRIVTKSYSTYTHTNVVVHAFNPELLGNYSTNLTSSILKKYDLDYPYIESKCQPFVIESKRILVDGIYSYHIFAYLLD